MTRGKTILLTAVLLSVFSFGVFAGGTREAAPAASDSAVNETAAQESAANKAAPAEMKIVIAALKGPSGMAAAKLLKEVDAADIGVLVSPSATLEEQYLAAKLVRGLGGRHIDHRLRQGQRRGLALDAGVVEHLAGAAVGGQCDLVEGPQVGAGDVEIDAARAAVVAGDDRSARHERAHARVFPVFGGQRIHQRLDALDVPAVRRPRLIAPGGWIQSRFLRASAGHDHQRKAAAAFERGNP